MSNNINKLLQQAKVTSQGGDLSAITVALKAIKQALVMLLLNDEIEAIKKPTFDIDKSLENLKKRKSDPFKVSMENLERHCTTKIIDDEVHFLLHRATESGEYQKSTDDAEDSESADLFFESDKDTSWMIDVQASEEEQKNRNPHVSCFIPKSAIVNIEDFGENTGTWGELSDTHPDQNKAKVYVEPGKYRLHQELRQ